MNFKANIHEEVSRDEIAKMFGYSVILPINNEHNLLQGRIDENQHGIWWFRTWNK